MTGYQDFAKLYGSGTFIRSDEIKPKKMLQKAIASLYVIPVFFKGIYYIPTGRERKGHFIRSKQDFFTSLFNFRYGRKRWYWGLSSAARHYGIEWSATKILEIVVCDKSKTIDVSEKINQLNKKSSYRSATLAKYLGSLEINSIYAHKGDGKSFSSLKIDDTMGPICSKEQIRSDIEKFIPKIKDRNLKKIYKRILAALSET